jgi:hypothetical protein
MTKQQLLEAIRRIIKAELAENAPAPSKPKETPGPAVAPGEPEEEPDEFTLNPEDPSTLPNVAPKARAKKATMSEAEMLAKIIKKYRTAKKNG